MGKKKKKRKPDLINIGYGFPTNKKNDRKRKKKT